MIGTEHLDQNYNLNNNKKPSEQVLSKNKIEKIFSRRNNEMFSANNNISIENSNKNIIEKNLNLRKQKIQRFTLKHMYASEYQININNNNKFTEKFPEYKNFLELKEIQNLTESINSEISSYISRLNITDQNREHIIPKSNFDEFLKGVFNENDSIVLFSAIAIRKILNEDENKNLFNDLIKNNIIERLINLSLNFGYKPLILETLLIINSYILQEEKETFSILKSNSFLDFIHFIYKQENEIMILDILNSLIFNLLLENNTEIFLALSYREIMNYQLNIIKSHIANHKEILRSYELIYLILINLNKLREISKSQTMIKHLNGEIIKFFNFIDFLIDETSLYYFFLETSNFKSFEQINEERIFDIQFSNKFLNDLDRIEIEILKIRFTLKILNKIFNRNIEALKYLGNKHEKFLYFLLQIIQEKKLDSASKYFALEILDNFLYDEILFHKKNLQMIISNELLNSLIIILKNYDKFIYIDDFNCSFFTLTLFVLSNLFSDNFFKLKFLYPEKFNSRRKYDNPENSKKSLHIDYSPIFILKQIFQMFFNYNYKILHKEILYVLTYVAYNIQKEFFKFLLEENFLKILAGSLNCKEIDLLKLCIESLIIIVKNKEYFLDKTIKRLFWQKLNENQIFFESENIERFLSKKYQEQYNFFLEEIEKIEYELINENYNNQKNVYEFDLVYLSNGSISLQEEIDDNFIYNKAGNCLEDLCYCGNGEFSSEEKQVNLTNIYDNEINWIDDVSNEDKQRSQLSLKYSNEIEMQKKSESLAQIYYESDEDFKRIDKSFEYSSYSEGSSKI